MCRLFTLVRLYQSGFVVGKYISLEQKIALFSRTYNEALEKCNPGWHENRNSSTLFTEYMLGILTATYAKFEDRVHLFEKKLSAPDLVRKAASCRLNIFTT